MPGRVLVIDCGGTISSTHGDDGKLANHEGSTKNLLDQEMTKANQSKLFVMKGWSLHYETGIIKDSSTMVISDWQAICQHILDNHESVSGVVVTHGTDTLAYSAAALSFGINCLPFPVVLTAAQFSLAESYSDAPLNFLGACVAAFTAPPGVFVFMNHKLMLGTRIMKFSATDIDSFETFRANCVGVYSKELILNEHVTKMCYLRKVWIGMNELIKRMHSTQIDTSFATAVGFTLQDYARSLHMEELLENLLLKEDKNPNAIQHKVTLLGHHTPHLPAHNSRSRQELAAVISFWDKIKALLMGSQHLIKLNEFSHSITILLFPGLEKSIIQQNITATFQNGPGAVLFVAYGSGNGPSWIHSLYDIFPHVLFAVCSICPKGSVGSEYEAGLVSSRENVANCYDMTMEASYVKLCWVLSRLKARLHQTTNQGPSPMRIAKNEMEQDFLGEVSPNFKLSSNDKL